MVEQRSAEIQDSPTNKHYELVRRFNEQYQDRLQEQLRDADIPGDSCIALVGSHGKLEGTPYSKPEIIVISERIPKVPITHNLLRWYDATYGNQSMDQDFDLRILGYPENKIIESGHLSAAFSEREEPRSIHQYYPDRVINAVCLTGNPHTLTSAKEAVFEEIGKNEVRARHVRQRMSHQLKEYRRVAANGLFMNRPVFEVHDDSTYGTQHYDDGTDCLTTGFKIPFIRATHRALDLCSAQLVRDGKIAPDKLAEALPTPTIDKIKFFRDHGLSDIDPSVEEAYKWFLREYHRIQAAYYQAGQGVSTQFDKDEFQRHKEVILRFATRS